MSEKQPTGPLDVVRGIEDTGRKINAVARGYLNCQPEEINSFTEQLEALNYAHPWAGQEVEVYGTPLTISREGEEEPIPYTLPLDQRPVTTRGLYNGMVIRKLYDSQTGEYGHQLLHMLYQDSSPMMLDDYGLIHQIHFYDYVYFGGSEVRPILPIAAHSAMDLAGDPVIAVVDDIVASEVSVSEAIARLGSDANQALAKEEIEFEPIDLNHQRASYINACGFHEMVQLGIEDLLLGGVRDDVADFEHRFLAETGEIIPGIIQIAPGYDKLSISEEPLRGGPPELYARVEMAGDQMIMLAALKNVCSVKSLAII
jgi:hypothetical protein